MIRRAKTSTGRKVHATRGTVWSDRGWKGETFCGRKVAAIVVSYPMDEPDENLFVDGNTEPVDCQHCIASVEAVIGGIQNLLAGFSS